MIPDLIQHSCALHIRAWIINFPFFGVKMFYSATEE